MSSHPQIVAVAAIVFDGDRILAMRRAASKDAGAGLWETLSGRVAPGEAPLDAIRREISEECQLSVELDARPVAAYEALRGSAPMIVIVYRARKLAGEVIPSEEHDDFMWCSPSEFRTRTTLTKLADVIDYAAGIPW